MSDGRDAETGLELRFREALPDLVMTMAALALFGIGTVWYQTTGSLTGYFLALITFVLASLVVGTAVYVTLRMRRR